MAYRGSPDVAFFLINGYDVLGTRTQLDDSLEAILEETHGLGDTFVEKQFTGVRRAEITQQGFFDDAAGSVHDILSTGPGVSRILAYGIGGTATGAPFIGYEGAMQVNYERLLVRGELEKANARYLGNGTVEMGKVVRTYKAFTAVGVQSQELDLGASQAAGVGMSAYLVYNASAGEANVRVQEAPDATSWSTLFTFTKTASGFGAERLTTTGAVQRYVRVQVTTASATGDITAMNAFIGVVPRLTS